MDAIAAALITAVLGGPIVYLLGNRRLRYERLYEKRAVVIARISELVWRVQSSAMLGTDLFTADIETRDENLERSKQALDELLHYFYENKIWLDPVAGEKYHGLPTADFSVVDPYRMMHTDGSAEKLTRPIVYARRAQVNINATRCK